MSKAFLLVFNLDCKIKDSSLLCIFVVVNLSFSLILDNFKWKCLYDKQTHFKLLKEMVQLEKSCLNKSTSQIFHETFNLILQKVEPHFSAITILI